jgi:hypothetical protein
MDEVQSFSPLSLQIYVYYNRISLFLYFYFHFFSSDTLRIHYLFIYQTIFIVFALHSLCFCNVSNLLLQKNCLYNSVYIIIIILLFLLRIYNVIFLLLILIIINYLDSINFVLLYICNSMFILSQIYFILLTISSFSSSINMTD